jgi:hypothetical protein
MEASLVRLTPGTAADAAGAAGAAGAAANGGEPASDNPAAETDEAAAHEASALPQSCSCVGLHLRSTARAFCGQAVAEPACKRSKAVPVATPPRVAFTSVSPESRPHLSQVRPGSA